MIKLPFQKPKIAFLDQPIRSTAIYMHIYKSGSYLLMLAGNPRWPISCGETLNCSLHVHTYIIVKCMDTTLFGNGVLFYENSSSQAHQLTMLVYL